MRWTRLRVLALAALATIALYALVGFVVVPRIARAQIEKQSRAVLHREATVTSVRFNPFTLAAVVEGLELKDRDGAELFRLDRLAANLQVSGILRRAFRFREIVLEGPQAVARIAANGRLSIADLFETSAAEPPAGPKSSMPRVIVDHLAVRGGGATFIDESRSPRYLEAFGPLSLELHGLTTIPEKSGDHDVSLGIEGGAHIRWSGRQTVDPLRLEGTFDIEGLRLDRVWSYVGARNPLTVPQGRADVRCAYDVRRDANGTLAVTIKDADLTVRELVLKPRDGGEDWLALPLLEARGAQVLWPEARAEVREVRVKDPRVLVWLDANRSVNWQAAFPATNTATASEAKPWTAKLGVFEIVSASVRVEDRSFQTPVVADVTELAVKLENVTSDLKAPIPASLSARLNGSGDARVSGTVVVDPPTADVDFALEGVDLIPFKAYASSFPWVDLRRGVVGASGKLHVGPGSPAVRFEGAANLTDLQLAGAGLDRIVACRRAEAEGASVTLSPQKIRVAKLATDGAFVNLDIDREGNVNLKKILAAEAKAEVADSGAGAPTPPADPPDFAIRTIVLTNASAEFTDESLILPFGTKIHSINGSIKDLSTTAQAAARLALEGRIADTGYFKADGSLHVGAPLASTDVGVIFRGVSMPELTPYAAQFAGYSITKGILDVDVRYRIESGRLVGDHKVVAKDLTLGPKVEGAKGPGLPVRLAVALLKDKDGRIDLAVPIEGTIDSPEFNYKSVVWQAFKTILGNVAKAPFVAIGRLFGVDQEDLELVGFASGQADLPPPEQEKLVKLAAELSQKAELTVEVEGRFDPITDVEAIRRARLEQRIDARREATPDLETILPALYVETFSPERLEAERQKFLPAAASLAPADQPKAKIKSKTPPPPPKEGFDAAGFYDALRAQLLAADDVPQSALVDLAQARAASIVVALTAPGGLEASRVKLVEPAPVKRKKRGSELVASELSLSAGD